MQGELLQNMNDPQEGNCDTFADYIQNYGYSLYSEKQPVCSLKLLVVLYFVCSEDDPSPKH